MPQIRSWMYINLLTTHLHDTKNNLFETKLLEIKILQLNIQLIRMPIYEHITVTRQRQRS